MATARREGRPMGVVLGAVVAVTAVTGCQAFWETFGEVLIETQAAEYFEEVRAAAQEFVGSEPAGFVPPSVTVHEAERMLLINRGAPIQPSLLGFEPDDPWRVPFTAQVETEFLRRAFRDALAGETFWEAPLAEADTVVLRALRDILEVQDPADLAARMEERQAEIAAARTRLTTATEGFAEPQGFEVSTRLALASLRFFQVPVATEPEGGVVRMLTFLAYRKEEIRGAEPQQMNWRSVVQSPADLIGIYEVWVSWPETGREARERVEVRSDAPLVFRPTSPPPDG